MHRPDISLIVSTYQMPDHLRRVLCSIAHQTAFDRLEIIVTDDGSTDETAQIVADFARRVNKPVGFVTRPHDGFHLTRCRNDGARIASAPYLLFVDGDCLLPADHVEQYLRYRRRGFSHFSYCVRMERETTEQIQESAIAAGEFMRMAPREELIKLRKLHRKALLYQWIGHPTKPVLKGGNIGVWREDFDRVNGFDENFRSWGCEDDDLSARLRAAGVKIASLLGVTRTYHLWHPPASSKPAEKWRYGANVAYLKRPGRLTACLNGLRKRRPKDLRVFLRGTSEQRRLLSEQFQVVNAAHEAEIEILFYPFADRFQSQAECSVLIAADPQFIPRPLMQQADMLIPAGPHMATELLQRLHFITSQAPQRNQVAA